jgi:hypothetical protein
MAFMVEMSPLLHPRPVRPSAGLPLIGKGDYRYQIDY